jgi:transcriptional regulator with XRE-family HTH domain
MATDEAGLHVFIGGRIREVRLSRGLTVASLARLVGTTPGQLRKFERAEVTLFAGMLWRISLALGVSIDDLHPPRATDPARADLLGWAERIAGGAVNDPAPEPRRAVAG